MSLTEAKSDDDVGHLECVLQCQQREEPSDNRPSDEGNTGITRRNESAGSSAGMVNDGIGSTHFPVSASYRSVNAESVGVVPSQSATVEMKRCFRLGDDTAATKSSQSSVGVNVVSLAISRHKSKRQAYSWCSCAWYPRAHHIYRRLSGRSYPGYHTRAAG